MLILGRKTSEKILIGSDIQIILIEATNHYARIGIQAPKSIPVYREEVYLRNLNHELNKHHTRNFNDDRKMIREFVY